MDKLLNRKWLVAALLLLPFALFARTMVQSSRYFHRTYAAIQIGMSVKDLPVFSADAPNGAKYDGVRCTASDKELSLRADDWRDLRDRGASFPPACRTMRVWLEGESFVIGREKAVFELAFDANWSVSKIGPMRTLSPF